MPFPVFITLSLQKLIDKILAKSPKTIALCAQLQDKVIEFTIQGVGATVYILVVKDGLEIMTEYDYPPDVMFSGMPSGYIALSKNPKKALVDKVVSVKGDFNVGQQFSDLIESVEVDMEAMFASTIGNDLAKHFFSKDKPSVIKKIARFKQKQWKDILQNKLNVLPLSNEIQLFNSNVNGVTTDVNRLEKNIQRLKGSLKNV